MKLFTISALAALVAYASAMPAVGHVDLAKRTLIATQTVVIKGKTLVQVVEAVTGTKTATVNVVKTVTVTETHNSFIYTYSGDDTSIINRLRSHVSNAIVPKPT